MAPDPTDHRREERYPIEANVIIRRDGGDDIRATATNISSAGMLLQVEQPATFNLADEVTVEVELPDHPDRAFSAWGVAKIMRIDGCRVGVQLFAGTFDDEN